MKSRRRSRLNRVPRRPQILRRKLLRPKRSRAARRRPLTRTRRNRSVRERQRRKPKPTKHLMSRWPMRKQAYANPTIRRRWLYVVEAEGADAAVRVERKRTEPNQPTRDK